MSFPQHVVEPGSFEAAFITQRKHTPHIKASVSSPFKLQWRSRTDKSSIRGTMIKTSAESRQSHAKPQSSVKAPWLTQSISSAMQGSTILSTCEKHTNRRRYELNTDSCSVSYQIYREAFPNFPHPTKARRTISIMEHVPIELIKFRIVMNPTR